MVEVGDVVLFMAEDGRYVRPAIVTTVWGAFCVNLRVINEPGDYGNQAEDYSHFVSSCTRCDGKLFPRSWIEKAEKPFVWPATMLPAAAPFNPAPFGAPYVPATTPYIAPQDVRASMSIDVPIQQQIQQVPEVIPQPVAPPVPAEAATPASSGDAVEGAKSPA